MIGETHCIRCGDKFQYPLPQDTIDQIENADNPHPDDVPPFCEGCDFDPTDDYDFVFAYNR